MLKTFLYGVCSTFIVLHDKHLLEDDPPFGIVDTLKMECETYFSDVRKIIKHHIAPLALAASFADAINYNLALFTRLVGQRVSREIANVKSNYL